MTFPELQNAVAVGSVTARSARLWARSERPGPLSLRLWPAETDPADASEWQMRAEWDGARDGTFVVTYPDDFAGAPALAESRRYRFSIVRHEPGSRAVQVGEGRFETAPPADVQGSAFCFAIMSCHQPFDEHGAIAPRAAAMLDRLEAALVRHDVKYTVLLGDQIYADRPERFSLFSPGGPLEGYPRVARTAAAIRSAYHRRYRQFWQTPFGSSLAQRASYVTCDDHEVIDNWRSVPMHQTEPWRTLGSAALDAAFDYQLSRNLPEARRGGPYYHSFRWGRTASFIADIRFERRAERGSGQIMSDEQIEALGRFLRDQDDCGALFIGLSVPLAFVPTWFVRLGLALYPGSHPGALDRWNWPGWTSERERLLELLLEQRARRPRQQLVLLSGDIHEWMAAALKPSPDVLPIYQLTSSPLTNSSHGVLPALAHAASRTLRSIEFRRGRLPVELLPGSTKASQNPHAELNVGIVEVDAGIHEASLRFKVLAPSAAQNELELAFDSGPLHPARQPGPPNASAQRASQNAL
jgi:alkaline phosphatase D